MHIISMRRQETSILFLEETKISSYPRETAFGIFYTYSNIGEISILLH